MKNLQEGDPVCWAHTFLTAVGWAKSDAVYRRGVITKTAPNPDDPVTNRLVQVKWDDGQEALCREENLCHAERRHLEPR